MKLLGIVLVFLGMFQSLYAQYRVTGGNGTPLMALNNTNYKLQVYLVNGGGDIQISYTSASTSHKWYRYKTKASEREPVSSTQNGTTSTVTNVEEGYGYYVDETDIMKSYVWIIDYNKYPFDIQSLRVSENSDPCYSLFLAGEMSVPDLVYYTPDGKWETLKREFEVSFQDLEWSEANKAFTAVVRDTIISNPLEDRFDAPLTDTEITLSGDLFARHFKREKTIATDVYQSRRIAVHADTTVVSVDADNQLGTPEEGYSAPVKVTFTAYTNTPTAAFFTWKIYEDELGPEYPIIQFSESQVEYTFEKYGHFTAELEVLDHTATCSDNGQTFKISIRESDLQIPNAFSPGTTPGLNDEFRVAYKSLVRFNCWIFNRWGVQLYHWSDPSQGWDGKYKGKYVSSGVYFYVIEALGSDGHKYKESGDINVLRPKTVDDAVIQ